MKKIILILCCLLFISTAFCQNSVTVLEQNVHGRTVKSIIREYRYPATITCVFSSDNSSTFIYSDQTLQTREFTIKNLKVNDMIVMLHGTDGRSDSLFFCGRDLNTGLATFGFFNINNAFNGSGPVSLHKEFLSGQEMYRVKELTRMDYFIEGENYHFVCVGTNEFNRYCIVEEVLGPPPSLGNYRAGTLQSDKEKLFDIKRVNTIPNDYIVTSGMDSSYGRYLTLRAYDISDIFAPSGIQGFKHIYCIDTSFGVKWERDDVLIQNLNDGQFATVSYLHPCLYSKVVWGGVSNNYINSVHVGSFRLNSLLSLSVTGMVSSTVFEPIDSINNTLTEFVRGPFRTLAFQERVQKHPIGETSRYCEIDFNNTQDLVSARKFDTRDDVYSGMDSYNFHNNYVMSGLYDNNNSVLKYAMETFSTYVSCYDHNKYDYIRYNPYRAVIMQKGFSVVSKRSEYENVDVEWLIVPLTIECRK